MPRSAGHNPTAQVGGLRMSQESDGTDANPPRLSTVARDSVTFRAVAAVVDLGLSLLETPEGKHSLAWIGREVISHRAHFDHIYEDRPENMAWWVDFFLVRLRNHFPPLVLTNHIRGEGEAYKANWARGGLKMNQWDPNKAGVMKLNKLIIQHLLRAGEAASRRVHPRKAHLAAFESFMFLMAITVAHEVVHFFTGFLTGYVLPPTPAEVSFLPSKYNVRWNGVELGESGRAWEATLLGGIIEGVEDPSHPLGVYQAGTFYLIDEQNQARRIDRHYVKRFLERNFTFPLRTTGVPTTLHNLDRETRRMYELRWCLLPSGLVQSLNRGSLQVISNENLRIYTGTPSYTVRDREFAIVRQASVEPDYLFVPA
ncbi:hypothetical protein F4823DRAFT_568460 [Ustulina deusta]|nr:hypothetical protein F4823DRAFT_568460 [Ustulina deusta]